MRENPNNILNAFAFLATFLCFVLASIFSSTVFILYFLGYIFTLYSFQVLSKSNKELVDTSIIFSLTIFFGSILALSNSIDYAENGVHLLYPDQVHFFNEAVSLGENSNSVLDVINSVYDGRYLEYELVYSLFGILAYIDKIVSGSIGFLPLLYSVVYVTSLIPVFLYHTSKLYLPNRLSFQSSLFYGVLTPIMAYSGYLLRDMHITLITTIALFLVVREVKPYRIFLIVMLIPIVSGMRASSSLLIVAMLIIMIFVGRTNRLMKFSTIVLGGVFLIYFSSNIVSSIVSTSSRLDGYKDFTEQRVEASSGLSAVLYKFPPVIKETSIVLFSLSAFPFLDDISKANTLPRFTMTLYNFITNIAWFFVFFGFFYFLKPIFRKLRSMPNKVFFWLLLLAFMFLFINTNNMTFRRLLAVFPFIYLPFLLVYNGLSHSSKRRYITFATLSAFSLQIVYLFLSILK